MSLFDDKEARLFDDEEIGAGIPQRAAYGQIWRLGKHGLMCGDSANTDQVNALMAGELADMVFTDPPYGVPIGDKNKTLKEVNGYNNITENIINDTLSAKDLKPILVKAMTNARTSCKDDAVYYVTSPQGGHWG